MVGPGTGVVPFIGFMQEREVMKTRDSGLSLAEAFLFFGCRKSTSDFIYREEIAKYTGEGIITESFVAFSRDNPNTRTYVQDLMQERKDLVVRVL